MEKNPSSSNPSDSSKADQMNNLFGVDNPVARQIMQKEFLKAKQIINGVDSKVSSPKGKNLLNMIALIKLFSTAKVMKEDNIPAKIINGLFLGSIGAASNLNEIKKNKITHIVVAASGLEGYFQKEIKYLQFDLLDSETQDIKQYFDKSGKFIDDAIKGGGNVLVHCHAGISRSTTLVLAYLIKYKKMSFEKALETVREIRPKINPNQGFIKQLKEYDLEVNK